MLGIALILASYGFFALENTSDAPIRGVLALAVWLWLAQGGVFVLSLTQCGNPK